MSDIETLLGEEAVDPHFESNDREKRENPASAGEDTPSKEGEELLPAPVRSPERRAEAFLTEWLRRQGRS